MKKLLSLIFALVVGVIAALSIAGCTDGDDGKIKVFVPDGAPALSLARAADDENFKLNVVDATTISAYVTGENPVADVCLLPVNAAVKLLGNGNKYKLLGTVTHGNLYLLKKEGGQDITTENLSSLIGKTVGIINLANVPGLMFKVILNGNSIPFNQLTEDVSPVSDKVNLKDVKPLQVLPTTSDCDYFVVAEPAASTKSNLTALSFAGNLQTLYGGANGFPQAVAVAKSSILEERGEEVLAYFDKMQENLGWLMDENNSSEVILSKITDNYYKEDTSPAFTAENLTKQVISNCGINYVKAADCKQGILDLMVKLNAISSGAWGTPSDGFFYV